MAGTLFQSTNIIAPASVFGKRHDSKQRGISGITYVRMICNRSVDIRGRLRMSATSLSIGGGGFNAVGKFLSKVSSSVDVPRGRGSQCVARTSMFEKFTDKGIEVINLAHIEATGMGHNYLGTAQVLLGLIAQETGIAAKVLKSMGICLKDARVEVEKIIGTSNKFIQVEIPFITQRVIKYAHEEARELGHNYIDSEHLLLGLLREEQCVAVRALENLGADPNNIRTQVIQMVNGENVEAAGDGVRGGNTNSKVPTQIPTHNKYRGFSTKLVEGAVVHMDPRVQWIRYIDRVTETSVNWPARIIMRAHKEAGRLGHYCMGTEHILLALIREGTGIAAEVLKSMRINLKDARVEVEKIIGRGNWFVTPEVPITPQAKRVLELSVEDARKLGHNYIGYDHLLLGLLHDGEDVAVCVLENLGADPNSIRTQVIHMIGESSITSKRQ